MDVSDLMIRLIIYNEVIARHSSLRTWRNYCTINFCNSNSHEKSIFDQINYPMKDIDENRATIFSKFIDWQASLLCAPLVNA